MNIRTQREFRVEEIQAYEELTDERIFRELCFELIKNVPYDDLQRLFQFIKIDPNTPITEETPKWVIQKKHLLSMDNMVFFEATLNIPENK